MVLGSCHQFWVNTNVFKHRLNRQVNTKFILVIILNHSAPETLMKSNIEQTSMDYFLTFTTSSKVSMFSFML